MIILVTGVNGQLGHDCVNEADKRAYTVYGSDITENYSGVKDGSAVTRSQYIQLDITDSKAVAKAVGKLKPDVIIHCAAWTAVDAAEDEENRARVLSINADGTRYLVEAAKAANSKILYLSTDYVFDGKGCKPWKPDDINYSPINVYGKSKLAGEQAVSSIIEKFFIVRIAWVFGLNGKNFIKTMINVGRTHDIVRVVDDQVGTPTYTRDLARLLLDMVETEKYGYYHATNSECKPGEYISWADLAEEAYRIAGMNVKVERVTTEEYGLSKAVRPKNSRLDKTKLVEAGFEALPDWKDAVKRYIEEAGLAGKNV